MKKHLQSKHKELFDKFTKDEQTLKDDQLQQDNMKKLDEFFTVSKTLAASTSSAGDKKKQMTLHQSYCRSEKW